MHTSTKRLAIASLILASANMVSNARAQSGSQANPTEAATTPAADKPATISPMPAPVDPEAALPLDMLTGSFKAESEGERPALVMNSAPIVINGLSGTVYFEIARADAAYEPFRSGVFHVYKRRGSELRLRVFDLVGVGTMRDALAGMYLAPQSFPALSADGLDPNVDVPLASTGDGFSGRTPSPVPTMRDGAVEMTSAVLLSPKALSVDDRGFDAAGTQVWGPSGTEGVRFSRVAQPAATVRTTPEGLVIMTMVPPAEGAERLVPGGQIAVQYTGWLTNGTRFDTSRQPGREAFLVRIPGGVIRGWNEGLEGIAKGERRRLVVPAALAYGERGAGRGLIPPNSTLIFDVECLHVDNSNPVLPTPPAAPNPAGGAPGQPGTPNPSTPGTGGSGSSSSGEGQIG